MIHNDSVYTYLCTQTASSKDGLLTFQPSEWAPGIWAGSEGFPVKLLVDGTEISTTVKKVMLDNRQVMVDTDTTASKLVVEVAVTITF